MTRRRGRILAAVSVAGAAAVVGVVVATLAFGHSDLICKGVTISGIRVGGMHKADAAELVHSWARGRAKQRIRVVALGDRWTGTLASFGAVARWRQAVDDAFAIGRKGNILYRAECVLTGSGSGKRIDVETKFAPGSVDDALEKIKKAIDRPHRDARLRVVDGNITVVQDVWGIRIDADKAAAEITRGLRNGDSVVTLTVAPDKPNVVASDVSSVDTLLARYVTSFNRGKVGRTRNLTLAAKTINGTILNPGQTFSLNKIVGPRLGSRGYQEAQVFIKGKLVPGLGGGVCQVSSTLYNAVLLADLNVLERHHHSQTVPYVVPGRDATVAYGMWDMRFENSNSSPVAILTEVKGSRLCVDIYGAAKDKKQVEVFTGEVKRCPAGVMTVVDASLKPGARKVLDKGCRGAIVTVYKRVTAPDGTKLTTVVSKNRYAPQKSVVAVGSVRKIDG